MPLGYQEMLRPLSRPVILPLGVGGYVISRRSRHARGGAGAILPARLRG